MNATQLASTVDAVAFRDAAVGHGYADTQRPWAYRPAIDLPRAAWQAWLGFVFGRMRRPTVHYVAAAPQPAVAQAMQCLGAQVRTLDCQQPAAGICDVLLLDADDAASIAGLWGQHAGSVRAGGIVAIVDRCQDALGELAGAALGALLLTLEANLLVPAGQRWLRCGDALCIHSYVQTTATQMARLPVIEPWQDGAAPRRLGVADGFARWRQAGRCYAVPAAGPQFSLRNLHGNRFDVVLVADDEARLQQRVGAWLAAQGPLAAAGLELANEVGAAAARVAEVVADHPDLPAALVAAVEAAPWCKELLFAAGLVQLFGTEPRLGGALLRRRAGIGLDGKSVACAGAAYLQVLGDEVAARALLDSVQQEVRLRCCAASCRELPRDHVLWQYPDLLVQVRGVLEVGLQRGGHIPAWQELGVLEQCYVEGDPRHAATLASAAAGAKGRVLQVGAALAASAGPRQLWRESSNSRAAWLRPLGGGVVEAEPVAVTLDELAGRAFEPRHYNLLVVDAAGAELEILRGARAVLAGFDFLCITLWPQARHAGAPLPQDVQGFLRDALGGDDGFGLAAYEPATDGVHGTALFRRNQAARGTA